MVIGNYLVKFVHYKNIETQDGVPMELVVEGAASPVHGLTTCSIYDKETNELIVSATAYRVATDQPNRTVGRDLSFKRALRELVRKDALSQKQRTNLVQEYLVKHPTSLRRAAGL